MLAPLLKKYTFLPVYNPNEQDLKSIQLRETRVFRLRSNGLKVASGVKIILLEDHCEITSNWFESIQTHLNNSKRIVGGPVENGSSHSFYHWSLYWSEYAAMMPPLPEGSIPYISAVNCAYDKSALDSCKETWLDGFYDNEVHDALIGQGASYYLAPGAIVRTSLPFKFSQALVHLYTGGKRYGRYRGGNYWNLTRLVRILSTILVPAVLLTRVFNIVLKRQPNRIKVFIFAWPILYLLLSAWGFGEMIGTILGNKNKN